MHLLMTYAHKLSLDVHVPVQSKNLNLPNVSKAVTGEPKTTNQQITRLLYLLGDPHMLILSNPSCPMAKYSPMGNLNLFYDECIFEVSLNFLLVMQLLPKNKYLLGPIIYELMVSKLCFYYWHLIVLCKVFSRQYSEGNKSYSRLLSL